eukprot:5070064-Amphidinium_carterae.2
MRVAQAEPTCKRNVLAHVWNLLRPLSVRTPHCPIVLCLAVPYNRLMGDAFAYVKSQFMAEVRGNKNDASKDQGICVDASQQLNHVDDTTPTPAACKKCASGDSVQDWLKWDRQL